MSNSKGKSICTFCHKYPAMLTCRDCQEPAVCYGCTIYLPTGGFCEEHLERFARTHLENHKQELDNIS